MLIGDIFAQKGKHLYWHRIDDDHVHPSRDGDTIEPEEAYFLVRMTGMYLARTRLLWRKYYPMLHAFTTSGKDEEHAVVGPGQLKELGDANLDRMVVLNHRLVGPLPFRGQDVSILVGLYSVPGQDAAKALVATVGSLAALGGVALGSVKDVADAVKQGVESVLSLGETTLQLGIRDTFFQHNPLKPGYHVGIAAEEKDIDVNRLWLSGGKLVVGDNPVIAKPLSSHDYMVLEIERRETRDDWRALPGLQEVENHFGAIMREGGLSVDVKRERLGQLWPTFRQALEESPYLVQSDREGIALKVAENLKIRLDVENPFDEKRGWAGENSMSMLRNDFDLLDVEDRQGRPSPESVAAGRAALSGNPLLASQ